MDGELFTSVVSIEFGVGMNRPAFTSLFRLFRRLDTAEWNDDGELVISEELRTAGKLFRLWGNILLGFFVTIWQDDEHWPQVISYKNKKKLFLHQYHPTRFYDNNIW